MQVLLPLRPAPDAEKFDKLIWQEEYKDKREKLRRLEENKSKACTSSRAVLAKCNQKAGGLTWINKLGRQEIS